MQLTSPAFSQARSLLATLYLVHRRDTAKYIAVFSAGVSEAKARAAAGVAGAGGNGEEAGAAALRGALARAGALEELGHAYMRVGEPEEAVEAYTAAQSERRSVSAARSGSGSGGGPSAAEEELARAIGKALVASHDYRRAVKYYEGALAASAGGGSSRRAALRGDFTELLLRLHRLEAARALLDEALGEAGVPGMPPAAGGSAAPAPAAAPAPPLSPAAVKDVAALRHAVRGLATLAAVQAGAREEEAARGALRAALAHQRLVVECARSSGSGSGSGSGSPGAGEAGEGAWLAGGGASAGSSAAASSATAIGLSLEAEKAYAAELCCELGALLGGEEAAALYAEAARVAPGSEAAHLAVAGSALARGDSAGCRAALTTVTALNPGSASAAVMLADVLFKEADSRSALAALGVLLDKQPCNYGVMHKLVLLLRRERRLGAELPRLLRNAVRADSTASTHAGYRYLQALGHVTANEVRGRGARVCLLCRVSCATLARRAALAPHPCHTLLASLHATPPARAHTLAHAPPTQPRLPRSPLPRSSC